MTLSFRRTSDLPLRAVLAPQANAILLVAVNTRLLVQPHETDTKVLPPLLDRRKVLPDILAPRLRNRVVRPVTQALVLRVSEG